MSWDDGNFRSPGFPAILAQRRFVGMQAHVTLQQSSAKLNAARVLAVAGLAGPVASALINAGVTPGR